MVYKDTDATTIHQLVTTRDRNKPSSCHNTGPAGSSSTEHRTEGRIRGSRWHRNTLIEGFHLILELYRLETS